MQNRDKKDRRDKRNKGHKSVRKDKRAKAEKEKRFAAPAIPKARKKTEVKPGPMLYPLPPVMVSCGTMEESNILTVAWTGIVNSDPPMTYISVRKSRYSHHIIEERKEFVINLTSRELTKACDLCGVRSGHDMDKFEAAGLTKETASHVDAPMIAESPISLECVVKSVTELPSHDMFLAEIVAVHIDEELISAEGRYKVEDMDLVSYCHGEYLPVGHRPLGFFGYSIMKPKTRKKLNKNRQNGSRR
ncbi:flavin reductase family protein [Mobilibacterium timonense]|uniref:flavin reductase family protein n=1 Tax=Mobilibacterium timonense TaxID=1871012 RepID=UPI002ED58546